MSTLPLLHFDHWMCQSSNTVIKCSSSKCYDAQERCVTASADPVSSSAVSHFSIALLTCANGRWRWYTDRVTQTRPHRMCRLADCCAAFGEHHSLLMLLCNLRSDVCFADRMFGLADRTWTGRAGRSTKPFSLQSWCTVHRLRALIFLLRLFERGGRDATQQRDKKCWINGFQSQSVGRRC